MQLPGNEVVSLIVPRAGDKDFLMVFVKKLQINNDYVFRGEYLRGFQGVVSGSDKK